MKNKILIKTLSAILAVVMVLCSAPLSGFVGLNFPELKLPEWNLFDFSIKSEALTEGIYTYEVSNGEATITDCSTSVSGTLVIPSTLGGYRVTSIGNEAFYDCDGLASVTIPDSVTSIGEKAFYDCDGLTSVTFPDSVTSIGGYVFYDCTSIANVYYTGDMESWCGITFGNVSANPVCQDGNFYINNTLVKEIIIPDTVTEIKAYAFTHCDSFTSVIISDSVTSIGDYAFYKCGNLTSVTIGDSVTSIGSEAFYDCTSLTRVYYTGDMESWCGITFGNVSANPVCQDGNFYINNTLVKEIIIPDTVTEIKAYAFAYCESLISVTIPDSVTSIGISAFSNCTNLISVTIGDSVTSIGNYAFKGCSNLTSVTIPDSVTSIGNSAFSNCTNLISVTIPDSVTSIGNYAFESCESLTSVTIPDSVTSIGKGAFAGSTNLANVYYTGDTESWCGITFGNLSSNPIYFAEKFYIDNTHVKEIVIPDTVTGIKPYAFCGFEGVTSVTIPDSVTSIGNSAFEDCTNLASVTIPDSVTSIGGFVFYNCKSLTSVTIGDGVTSIGNYAFSYCTGLKELTMPVSAKIYNSEYTFYNCTNIEKVTLTKGTGVMRNYGTSTSSSATETFYQYTPWYISRNKIEEIVIEDGVMNIGAYAFVNCIGLVTFTIPSEVIIVRENAFYGCEAIEKIYFLGTEEEWNEVVIRDGNDPILNAKKVFIPAGHEHQYDEFVSAEPTCIEDGVKTFTCSCGESYTEKIPATGHGERIVDSENPPTCTETGMRYYKCSVCGFDGSKIVYSTSDCPQSSHNYSNYENDTKTFSSPGAEKLILKFSSQTQVENGYDYIYIYNGDGSLYGKYTGTSLSGKTIELEGDSFSINLTSDYSGTAYGYSFDSITAIFADDSYQEVIPATGHTSGTAVEENRIEATCTEKGSYDSVVYCSVCGEEISRKSYTMDALGHTSGEAVEENRVEPTMYIDGSYDEVVYCTVCGESLSRKTFIIYALGTPSADYTELNTLKEEAAAIDRTVFTDESLAELDKVLAKITDDMKLPQQDIVDGWADELEAAIAGLRIDVSKAKANVQIALNKASVAKDDIITVTVKLTTNYYVFALQLPILYDKTQFELVGNTGGKSYLTFNPDSSFAGRYDLNGNSGITKGFKNTSDVAKWNTDEAMAQYDYAFITAAFTSKPNTMAMPKDEVFVTFRLKALKDVEDATESVFISPDWTKTSTLPGGAFFVALSYTEGYTNAYKPFATGLTYELVTIAHNYIVAASSAATCTKRGHTTYTCSVCGDTYTDYVDALSHTEGEAVEENRVEETCTESGAYDTVVYCSVCGEELSRETKSIAAKGHRFGAWVVTTEPTMTTDGVKERECSSCGKTETGVEPKTGITVTLIDAEGNVISETVVEGDVTEYTFDAIEDGEYTVTVSKENYVSREYTITAEDGEVSCEFKLNHTGDINGDGKVNTIDVARANASAKGVNSLTGYDLACADINGDGKVNTIDVARINAHAKGVTTLW